MSDQRLQNAPSPAYLLARRAAFIAAPRRFRAARANYSRGKIVDLERALVLEQQDGHRSDWAGEGWRQNGLVSDEVEHRRECFQYLSVLLSLLDVLEFDS